MNQDDLIKKLIQSDTLKSRKLLKVFRKIDRADFVTPESLEFAYQDSALALFNGQTISQPTTVAFMLEKLEMREGLKVLEIGFGSGWQTAIISGVIGRSGRIDALEINKEIFDFGFCNLKKYNFKNINLYNESVIKYLNHNQEKYDRIISGAAFLENHLDLIKKSLKIGGISVIPTQDNFIKKIIRKEDGYIEEDYYGFVFVPLRV